MTSLLGAYTTGLILALMALGVFISFRLFRFPDITTDGSITLGGAVSVVLLVGGTDPWLATGMAFVAGALAGAATGVLHTKFKINELLSGILVMTALYSINLRVMGKSNIPILRSRTILTDIEAIGTSIFGAADGNASFNVFGWEVMPRDLYTLMAVLGIALAVAAALRVFFHTDFGTAMRATGDSPQMVRALGVNVETMIILGMALANGLIAVSGALLAQFQGYVDVQMGIGMVVSGLAAVIIGESLLGSKSLGLTIVSAILGSILFRLLIAIAIRFGLEPNDMKFITALFVFAALVLPKALPKMLKRTTPSIS